MTGAGEYARRATIHYALFDPGRGASAARAREAMTVGCKPTKRASKMLRATADGPCAYGNANSVMSLCFFASKGNSERPGTLLSLHNPVARAARALAGRYMRRSLATGTYSDQSPSRAATRGAWPEKAPLILACRLITYWPARSMLGEIREIRDAHRPSNFSCLKVALTRALRARRARPQSLFSCFAAARAACVSTWLGEA